MISTSTLCKSEFLLCMYSCTCMISFLYFWKVKLDDGCLVQPKHVAFWVTIIKCRLQTVCLIVTYCIAQREWFTLKKICNTDVNFSLDTVSYTFVTLRPKIPQRTLTTWFCFHAPNFFVLCFCRLFSKANIKTPISNFLLRVKLRPKTCIQANEVQGKFSTHKTVKDPQNVITVMSVSRI